MFCVYSLLEFLSSVTPEANAAIFCECVVLVCDMADADHKQWAALLKTILPIVTEAEINALFLLSVMEKLVLSDHCCKGLSADVE